VINSVDLILIDVAVVTSCSPFLQLI